LGTYEDGRRRSARRPRAGSSHPDVAGRQRSSRCDGERRLLVPPVASIAARAALDESFQDALLNELIGLTDVRLALNRGRI
jgi:hypothetical protein